MSEWSDRFTGEMYNSAWKFMVPLLKVPTEPPELPGGDQAELKVFNPAPGFLLYMKLWFWIVTVIIDLAIFAAWIILTVNYTLVGFLLFIPVLVLMFLPDLIAFVAIQLKYNNTWYAMTDRALRIRRGVWIIRETTISFENVQNVSVRQGPVQRHFDISNVIIETAGGGGDQSKGLGVSNQGVIEGISDAATIRDLILKRMRVSQSSGLGDDEERSGSNANRSTGWTAEHVEVLREIRDLV